MHKFLSASSPPLCTFGKTASKAYAVAPKHWNPTTPTREILFLSLPQTNSQKQHWHLLPDCQREGIPGQKTCFLLPKGTPASESALEEAGMAGEAGGVMAFTRTPPTDNEALVKMAPACPLLLPSAFFPATGGFWGCTRSAVLRIPTEILPPSFLLFLTLSLEQLVCCRSIKMPWDTTNAHTAT